MHKRHYAQRRHIIHSLDVLCYQMHTLSFFLSPSIWIIICRLLCQIQCSKPSEVESGRSLRPFLAIVLFFNGPALWNHATQRAAEGRAVVLDFIGMSYAPSKFQLLGLDCFIMFLQMVLTIIAYETTLWQNTKDVDSEDILAPAVPTPPPSSIPSPSTSSPSSSSMTSNNAKISSTTMESHFVMDLRLGPLIARLRNPTPRPRTSSTDSFLPLPNTTSWPLPSGVRELMRASTRMRHGVEGSGTEAGEHGGQRTLPGTLDVRES
ncbi:hypothetical protein BDQ17DRAFT_1343793 [Cyathus striatus]|nr:hypothetical protein BDQ17DRAFT_1343793 [Cyathus striatus]